MQVSASYIAEFSRRLDFLEESAQGTLARLLEDVDLDDWDAVAAVVAAVCRPYTTMSAAITAQFYDGIRRAANAPGDYEAEAYSGYEPESAEGAVKARMRTGEAPAVASGKIASREVNNASRECVRHNCRRDPARPKYASVPTGANPCAWCVMRASAGFVYDADSGSHDHCKCRLVPGFKGAQSVEGYDQGAYEDEWNEAASAYRSGNISDEMKQRIADAKARHAEDLAAGRDTKPWDSTNAILMVMRENRK